MNAVAYIDLFCGCEIKANITWFSGGCVCIHCVHCHFITFLCLQLQNQSQQQQSILNTHSTVSQSSSNSASSADSHNQSRPSVPTRTTLEPNGIRPRKPCNCTKSQCLKLWVFPKGTCRKFSV